MSVFKRTVPPLTRALVPGDTGDLVLQMQRELFAKKNVGKFQVNGVYDKNTEKAVRKFQENKSLPIHGAVDIFTWRELWS